MRAGRQIAQAQKNGVDLSTLDLPEVQGVQEEMMQCPNCGRTFNMKAGERHVKHCKNIKNKPKRLMRGAAAKRANQVRTNRTNKANGRSTGNPNFGRF